MFPAGSTQVLELDYSAYVEQLDSVPRHTSPDWVILHYSSMCGHCKRFSTDFSALAARYSNGSNVRFGAIDLYEPCNKALVREKNIKKVPLLQRMEVVRDFPGGPMRVATTLPVDKQAIIAALDPLYGGDGVSATEDSTDANNGTKVPLRDDGLSYLLDAASAMSFTLNNEIFRGNASVLTTEEVGDLVRILEVCASNFALNSVRSDCASLLNNLVIDEPLSHSSWMSLLSQTFTFAPLDTVPRLWSCESPTCALWRLLHVFSIETEHTSIQPIDGMTTIRTFVDKYMSCEECRGHFLEHFDACDFGRCDSKNPTWKKTTLWLWRFHNAVTLRVNPQRAQWPSQSDCPSCNNEDQIFDFLTHKFSLTLATLRASDAATVVLHWWWTLLLFI